MVLAAMAYSIPFESLYCSRLLQPLPILLRRGQATVRSLGGIFALPLPSFTFSLYKAKYRVIKFIEHPSIRAECVNIARSDVNPASLATSGLGFVYVVGEAQDPHLFIIERRVLAPESNIPGEIEAIYIFLDGMITQAPTLSSIFTTRLRYDRTPVIRFEGTLDPKARLVVPSLALLPCSQCFYNLHEGMTAIEELAESIGLADPDASGDAVDAQRSHAGTGAEKRKRVATVAAVEVRSRPPIPNPDRRIRNHRTRTV